MFLINKLDKMFYTFFLVVNHTFIFPDPPNIDFGSSTTTLITLVPAKASFPGLLKPVAVPAKIA